VSEARPDVVVERLRIVCRSNGHDGGDGLRVRRRLQAVARSHLPGALEQAVPWRSLNAFGVIELALDFDPRRYDDVTVALLWADRIRQRLLAEPRGAPWQRESFENSAAPASPPAPVPESAEGHVRDDPESLALRALAGDETALRALDAACATEQGEQGFLDALAGALRDEVHSLLARRRLEAMRVEARASGKGKHAARAGSDRGTAAGGKALPSRAADSAPHSDPSLRSVDGAAARARRSRPAGRSSGPGLRRADRRHATGVAGLALLWPWLGDFLDQATSTFADRDAVGVRRAALARLVPDLRGADRDELVRFLAGDELDEPPAALAPPRATEELDSAAAGVLQAFAGALRGLERSSHDYLRRELIVRPGELDLEVEPVRITLARRPLDPVLALLPYPLAVARLAWTRTFAIHVEPSL
jgi:hypothetical protein